MAQVGVKATLSLPVHDHATDPAGGKLSYLAVDEDFYRSRFYLTASDYLANSNDAEKTNNNTSPILFKEVKISENCTWATFVPSGASSVLRIKFDLDSDNPSYLGQAQVYLNGTPKGTLRVNAGGYFTFTEDINFGVLKDNDLIQLYAYSENPSANVKVRNFRIYGTLNMKYFYNIFGDKGIFITWSMPTFITFTNTLT